MIEVKGTLITPTTFPIAEAKIRIIAINSPAVLPGMVGSIATTNSGVYDFSLVEGTHRIEVNFADEYHVTATVVVDGSTPTPITIETLVNDHKVSI